MARCAVSFRVVAGSAVGLGCRGWWVRASGRSFSGLVLVAWFSSAGSAAAFARRWSARCGVACRVSRRGGPGWLVSVPVVRVGR